jgi:hypothetical protein
LEAAVLRHAAGAAAGLSSSRGEISGALLKFRTESANVEARLGWIDKWIERANQKESAMSGRMDEERRRKREELAHEQKELNEINDRWAKL